MKNIDKKRGALITIVAMCLSFLFPIVQFTIIDMGRLYTVKEQLKFNLSAAAAGAVTFIDWENVYTGDFKLDTDNSADAIYTCLLNNLDPSFNNHTIGFQDLGVSGGVRRYRGTISNVTYYAEIYNSFGSVTLGGSRIPGDIIPNPKPSVATDKARSEQLWDLELILSETSKGAGSGGPLWVIGKN